MIGYLKLGLTALLMLGLSGCVVSHSTQVPESSKLERRYYNSWEKQIGYAQVVKTGNILHVSGITGSGDTMEQQLTDIYETIGGILKDYDAVSSDIIRETLFTTDMKTMRELIPLRKGFYSSGQYPAGSWLQVDSLFYPQLLLEIEVTVQLK